MHNVVLIVLDTTETPEDRPSLWTAKISGSYCAFHQGTNSGSGK
jgi:hypothetical protein